MMHEKKARFNTLIKPLKQCEDMGILHAFSAFEYGLFVWDYDQNICYVNEYMIDRFSIDHEKVQSLHEYLSGRIDDNSLFAFFERVYQLRMNTGAVSVEFPVKSRKSLNWYKLQMKYDTEKDITIGIISSLDQAMKNYYIDDDASGIYQSMLKQIGFPVCILNKNYDLIFSNFDVLPIHKKIYESIELSQDGTFAPSDSINEIKLIEKDVRESNYSVKFYLRNSFREETIMRSIVNHNGEEYLLFRHHRLLGSSTEQFRLRKILRANELMMEIKDIVDHIDDLNEMFNYLLSKIHTVIPEVSRSCILRLDNDDHIYLDESYGFNEEYVDEFRLPFSNSFAYMHLRNDYSKSVIINDIQKKYGDLFPDIKDDETRFNIQSNITTPLMVNNNLYGLISVDSDKNRVFDDVDLNLLDFMKAQIERAIVQFRKYRNIKKDSTEDSLTGVSNRRHLQQVILDFEQKSIEQNKSFYFVLFDIDKLKNINDSFGHNCGDEVIKSFAFTIQSNIRETDFISRVGGDEFVGLFYDVSESVLHSRINAWMNFFNDHPLQCKNMDVKIDFSYGVARYPSEGKYFSELMEIADMKMYQHKRRNRD